VSNGDVSVSLLGKLLQAAPAGGVADRAVTTAIPGMIDDKLTDNGSVLRQCIVSNNIRKNAYMARRIYFVWGDV
jgi:hypothetical protein